MADERGSGVTGYRIEHHTHQGAAVVRHLVNPDPLAISRLIDQVFQETLAGLRARGEGGVLVLIEDVTHRVVEAQAIQPADSLEPE